MKVIKETINSKNRIYHLVNCYSCNKEMRIRSDYYNKHSGRCLSCTRRVNKSAITHGKTKTRLFKIWLGLFQRRYKNYTPEVCQEWKLFLNFENWSLSNNYKDNLTIDRIDNSLGYFPENCQWITIQENAGKDKIVFTNEEKIQISIERKRLGLTQRQMANKLGVCRTTIIRAEKYYKEVKNEKK